MENSKVDTQSFLYGFNQGFETAKRMFDLPFTDLSGTEPTNKATFIAKADKYLAAAKTTKGWPKVMKKRGRPFGSKNK